MSLKRFDLGPLCTLQSRDGGIDKGGLIKNAFLEKAGDGVWSWQRPALVEGEAAPFTGTSLGMITLGGTLYAVGVNGTATTWTPILQTNTSYTLVAGTHTGGDNEVGFIAQVPVGSFNPTSLLKRFVNALEYNTPAGTRTLFSFGTTVLASSAFTALVIGVTTLARSSAVYGTSFYSTYTAATWRWAGSYVPSGTTTGRIIP